MFAEVLLTFFNVILTGGIVRQVNKVYSWCSIKCMVFTFSGVDIGDSEFGGRATWVSIQFLLVDYFVITRHRQVLTTYR